MQTFLPYPSFAASAQVLDRQRLGKQRVEAWQILRTLRGETTGWRNHPAVRMWCGYELALMHYGLQMCAEWRRRGFQDSMQSRFLELTNAYGGAFVEPPWLGDEAFHRSHQSNLVRKLPAHYGPLFPGVPDNLPYVWLV